MVFEQKSFGDRFFERGAASASAFMDQSKNINSSEDLVDDSIGSDHVVVD